MIIKQHIKKLTPRSLLNFYHLIRAIIAQIIYGFPTRNMRVYGITGTNGKTTTALMLYSILKAARHKVGLASTVAFADGKTLWQNKVKMTTLNPFQLHNLVKQMHKNGVTDLVLEVTSHALVQNRIWGINFDTVVFTNLTHDHLDYHTNKKNYRLAKEKLFSKPHRVSVVNGSDQYAKYFLRYPAKHKFVFGFSRKNNINIVAKKIRHRAKGISFEISIDQQIIPIQLNVEGDFNIENAMAAASVAWGLNIPAQLIRKGLEDLPKLPGRMEELDFGQPYRIIIDYAHTPDALKKVFEAVRPMVKGRIIHVGGATGNRDQSKRPILGAISGQYADVVLITNEDPDNEDPLTIMEAVARGVPRGAGSKKHFVQNKNFFIIPDRSQAIHKALALAKTQDLVLVTGKGDETSMVIKGKLVPYSDRKVIKSYFQASSQSSQKEENFWGSI